MWTLKLINHEGVEKLFECKSFEVTRFLPGALITKMRAQEQRISLDAAAGIEIRFTEPGAVSSTLLRLPEQGRVVYAMNSTGQVVDGYRWPPKETKEK